MLDALWTFIWPWPAVGHEVVELWHDWKSAAHRLFTPRGTSFWTFVQDLWTNVLTLVDFPYSIVRRLVRIVGALMGWVTIILVGGGAVLVGALGSLLGPGGTVAGAIAGAGAGLAVAGAAGEAALAAFAAVELTMLVKRLAELATGSLTAEEQYENIQGSADSAIGLAVAASVAAIMWLASRIASAAVNAVRRLRAPTKVETPPPEDTTTPPEATTKPGAPMRPGETATQFGERLGAESRGQPSRFDYVVDQVNAAGLSQADAEVAAAAATKAMGLRLARVTGGAGNTYLASVMPGPSRPILIVRPNGSVVRGTADIAIANPPSLERPFELTNIKDANGNPAEPTPTPPAPQLDPPEFKNAAEEASFERFRRLPGWAERHYGKSPQQEIDWVDSEGRAYDQIGNPRASQFWNQQRTNFMNQIDRHIGKADVVVLDLTGFTADQIAEVRAHIESLPPAQQAKIVRIGF